MGDMRERWEEVSDEIANKITRLMWGDITPERVALVKGWMVCEDFFVMLEGIAKKEGGRGGNTV